ncbi:MAG: AAA family ATPase [Deltaproteobacteria bacterium]|nr:AAA family ATPase [Deltaproteobacteria bacterium]
MNINFDKLRRVIEVHAKPLWNGEVDTKWPWRKGGGEIYVQEILRRASPFLTAEAVQKESKESLSNALKADVNLLAHFEKMQAEAFINRTPAEELRRHVRDLLYGGEDLGTRLKRFLEWARLEPIPETNQKKGLTPGVASYLLAMSNPQQYPFCKPRAYDSAVAELLGKDKIKRDKVARILHCQEFYSKILAFLKAEYGLEDGNLLDVHSMFYCFTELWERPGSPPPPPPHYGSLYELLTEKHNLVLYGPPGTGKTREAIRLGNWWKNTFGPDTVSQITFHPSYSYEDFIEGFRPTGDGSRFELREGIFKKLCRRAAAAENKKFLIIIDEINRGDVARILGELITILEGDKRGEVYSIILPQSGERFFVPENLYVLGTMNTADKSISLMDLAIRRRFLFFYFPPDPDVLDKGKDFLDEIENIRLSRLLVGLNQRLMDVGVDRDRVLGHSFFMISAETPNPLRVLKNRIQYEIIPLIEEYCYADRASMKQVLGDLVDPIGAVDTDVLEDDEQFLATLRVLSEIE